MSDDEPFVFDGLHPLPAEQWEDIQGRVWEHTSWSAIEDLQVLSNEVRRLRAELARADLGRAAALEVAADMTARATRAETQREDAVKARDETAMDLRALARAEELGVAPGDVVQCDPASSRWGAVFVVVTELRPFGVVGYFLDPGEAGLCMVRLKRGTYVRIGPAAFGGDGTKGSSG